MKICLHLQRNFVKVGHAMAIDFKHRYGVNDFCALVATRASMDFLQSQNDIAYTNLILDEDIHAQYNNESLDPAYLSQLEKKYGLPFLWPYLLLDRVLMQGQLIREYPYNKPQYTHEELLRIIQVTARAIENFLDQERPDMVFFSVIGNLSSLLLYHMAKHRAIPVYVGELSRFENQYMITDDYSAYTNFTERFSRYQDSPSSIPAADKEKAVDLIKSFRDQPRPYHAGDSPKKQAINRKRQFKFLSPFHWHKSLHGLWSMFYNYYIRKQKNDYTTISPWWYAWDRLKRKLRILRGYHDLYDAVDTTENFVYFPLAVEPEVFLLLYAPTATNQLEIIRHVARSLPLQYKLYVKEHPAMVGYRTRQFYKELKKMPNIKLIPPHTQSFELLPHCKLVTTITGTGGWEALFYKKPSTTFGHTFYNSISMVRYCESMHALPHIIKDQLKNHAHNEDELIAFSAALLPDTVPVDMVHIWHQEPDYRKAVPAVAPLVDLLASKINLAPTNS